MGGNLCHRLHFHLSRLPNPTTTPGDGWAVLSLDLAWGTGWGGVEGWVSGPAHKAWLLSGCQACITGYPESASCQCKELGATTGLLFQQALELLKFLSRNTSK